VLEKLTVSEKKPKACLHFIAPDIPNYFSKQHDTSSHSEPNKSNPQHCTPCISKYVLILSFQIHITLSINLFPLAFQTKI
jgi:hypothetical protein